MGIEKRIKDPLIGIIGGTGRMGSWFADICERRGYRVLKVGRRTEISMEDAAKRCDVVVISVPISVLEDVIKRVGPLISEDSLLMDLTSIKKRPIDAMLRYSKAEVIGLHPLFGMDIDEEESKRVAICSGRGERWKSWIIDLLKGEGLELVFLTPEEHDKIMGIVQGINHFETICLAIRIKESGIGWKKIESASTQTFMRKLRRIRKMFDQDPELFASLLMENSWSVKCIDSYMKDARDFFDIISKKDRKGFNEIFMCIKKLLKETEDERDMG